MSLSATNEQVRNAVDNDARWESLRRRDPNADGAFFYGVKTTGIYCRPSCAARRAKPENVQFFETVEQAEQAGFRPCKRCTPNKLSLIDLHTQKVTEICRLIEESETAPTLEELATHAELSPYHFHRVFKSIVGLTPKSYAAAHRAGRVRDELDKTKTVTEAIYNAGYNSNGRFYEESAQLLGMTPTKFRSGGKETTMQFAVGKCSLGLVLVAKSSIGICAIFLGDDAKILVRNLHNRFPRAEITSGDAEFEKVVSEVIAFIDNPIQGLDLPLDIRGTAFQQRVWQALQEIPFGKTASYTDIARHIGSPKSVRAVAQACGANPVAVVVPCHRVLRNDGALSGYRWGVERKRALLEKEISKGDSTNSNKYSSK